MTTCCDASVTDSAYFISPTDRPGPGVLLLHSWWGLTPFFRVFADRLSDEGYTVLAPDMNVGELFDDGESASAHLAEADVDRLASLVIASSRLLEERTGGPIAVVGFSMGASMALWASVRIPDVISAVAAFYGTQAVDFTGSKAAYQLHLAGNDALVTDDEAAFMQATMGLEGLPVEVWNYPDSRHWFVEADRPEFDADAAELAWDRLMTFLDAHLSAKL